MSIRPHITQEALEVLVQRGSGLNLEFTNQNPWQDRTREAEQVRYVGEKKWVSVASRMVRSPATPGGVKGDGP